MIGLVIVSHSARLAEGVVELARGMVGESVAIAAAGGLDLPDAPLGTDVAAVVRAIEQVASEDGVLILVDLGSAILSAEMARELMPPALASKILISEAPLVEGAVAAAVQARLGSSLAQVAAEARSALQGKQAQLGSTASEAPPSRPAASAPEAVLRLTVTNPLGLHARPAARLVQLLSRFEAEVTLSNLTTGRGPVDARSINRVTTLGVRSQHIIELRASGADAQAALAAVQQLADENFGDPIAAPAQASAAPRPAPEGGQAREHGEVRGLAASPGIAIGTVQRPQYAELAAPATPPAGAAEERQRLQQALDQTRSAIQAMLARVRQQTDAATAEIFAAHLLFLADEALLDPAYAAIEQGALNAAQAWQQAYAALVAQYQALEDEYLRARAADVTDVGQQVLARLLGQEAPRLALQQPGILVVEDLTPADTATLDTALVLGICAAGGSTTSHSAILARALGIPAVVGAGEAVLAFEDGLPLILDGSRGLVLARPDAAALQRYEAQQAEERRAQQRAREDSQQQAITRDGRRIEVAANIGSVADARQAVALGAEGVGLFRTEFLFLDRQTEPSEDEQYQAYRAVAAVLEGRPLIIRTLDVGGDKPLPYITIGREENPFLGLRALRLCLARPALFRTQLRAIVRAAAEHPIQIMFPMVATVSELQAARALLDETLDTLRAEGQPLPAALPVGMMVEIPSAALLAEQFAPLVDFFSIGTNDLTQYTLAAERGNPQMAYLNDAFQPSVLLLIRRVVEAAEAHGRWVGVCGEMAGDLAAIPLLIGLGVRELSMNANAIPGAKQLVRTLDAGALHSPALRAIQRLDPQEIRALMQAEAAAPPDA